MIYFLDIKWIVNKDLSIINFCNYAIGILKNVAASIIIWHSNINHNKFHHCIFRIINMNINKNRAVVY